jgi:UDP-N-acetylglucosamine-lysosomal-enzyme
LDSYRAANKPQRAYSFNPAQPDIDIVYTWVNGSDPDHQRELNRYLELNGRKPLCESESESADECTEAAQRRFEDHDELLYSLRSVHQHMPWVRNIFIVTNGQVPIWLNVSHPKIRIVTHKEIFKWQEHLPTFNSLAIESHLHRIPGLSEHFIYFNDDMLLANTVYPSTWYNQNDGQRLWFFWPLDQHPDVPYAPTFSYDRSQRCPVCETCPPCSNKDASPERPSDKQSPFFTQEIGDPAPIDRPLKAFYVEEAGRNGMDWIPEEWYPWEAEKEIENDPQTNEKSVGGPNIGAGTRSTAREELGRKILEAGSVRQSLLRTHKLMHEAFGFANRLEPSHLPLYIQKPLMERLRDRWPDEYYAVSSHRFRESFDMHFHFSYTYFLMHERQPFEFDIVFREMDSDHSNVLEALELQRLATTVLLGLHKRVNRYRSPPLATDWGMELVKGCEFSKRRASRLYANQVELQACPSAMDKIREWYHLKLRNRFVIGSDETDSKFLQVGTNPEIKREIEFIFTLEPKFVCLNDDIDYRDPQKANYFLRVVRNFYQTMYPHPSPFEMN